jgi:hypothetical protein
VNAWLGRYDDECPPHAWALNGLGSLTGREDFPEKMAPVLLRVCRYKE